MPELRLRGLACLLAVMALLGCSVPASSAVPPVDGVSVAERVAERTFPSVYQAWGPADNLADESPVATEARHDLLWNVPEFFGLQWNNPYRLLADGFTEGTVAAGLRKRSELLERNPSMVLLAEVRYRDSPGSDLPDSSPWWQRDAQGQRVEGWAEGNYYLLDWHNSAFREQVVRQAQAVVRSGVVDGIFLDWWPAQEEDTDRLSLLQDIREAIGPDALIMVNSNSTSPVKSAPYINGLYMETAIPNTANEAEEWRRATETLLWAETSLRTPTINALETWTCSAEPPFAVPCTDGARNSLHRMRATTTLVLTHSDGYALFADPNGLPTPDHLHDWYAFWDKSLGRPVGGGTERADGAFEREFEEGTVVYNPVGNRPVEVTFAAPRRSAASGKVASSFVLDAFDGDLYLDLVNASG
jgi:hypothetical protein